MTGRVGHCGHCARPVGWGDAVRWHAATPYHEECTRPPEGKPQAKLHVNDGMIERVSQYMASANEVPWDKVPETSRQAFRREAWALLKEPSDRTGEMKA